MTTQDLRLEAALTEMAALITRFTAAGDGWPAPAVKGLTLHRASEPRPRLHGVQNPCVCVIAQGAKRVMLGDDVFLYDRAHYLAASVDLPVSGQVVEASADMPYLSLKLDVDPHEIAALLLETPPPLSDETAPARGLFLSKSGAELTEASLPKLRLVPPPQHTSAL